MIISEEEFTIFCNSKNISNLQLAFLMFSQILPPALSFRNNQNRNVYLFDDVHKITINSIINNYLDAKPKELIKLKLFKNIQQQNPGLSDKVSSLIKSQTKFDNSYMNIKTRSLNDISLPQKTKTNRLIDKFNPFQIRLTGKEQLELIASIAVAQAMFPSHIVNFYSKRIWICNLKSTHDRCLQEYINSNIFRGWGFLEEDINLIESFCEQNRKFLEWPIRKSLLFIEKIENSYKQIERKVSDYRTEIKNDEELLKLLAFQFYYPMFNKILVDANKRSIDKIDENLDKLTESFSKIINYLVKWFIPQSFINI